MAAYEIKFRDARELAEALKALGADMRSLPFFDNRREIRSVYITDVDVRAANVIKQEMLSRGGDAAVHAHAVDCGVTESDVILFGTVKQISFLADKLETMPWWGFPDTVKVLREALASFSKKPATIDLPSGSSLAFGGRTLLMSIINLSDDSFHSESRTYGNVDVAVARAVEHAKDGADILDLGAESTRPGAARISESEEIGRIMPVIREIRKILPLMPISVDTTREKVAKTALEAGADIINDISGLTFEPGIARAVADHNAMLVIMHMRGTPETMGSMCIYSNLLKEINDFFDEKIRTAISSGVDRAKIILDPGVGFAKDYSQNLFLLRHLESFRIHSKPILIGASRKGSVGKATDSPDTAGRLEGTLAVSALCAWAGVDIIRVHDTKENKKAVMMAEAIRNADYA
ncbi:MAG TPA: dihydropteroate synthase [Synergistaceae bacterium]|jgi:dihydropteroate synthase|uniref:dihydropteroate synthase n=1 Tax=Synergistaceae TaxID=649777 RepID=UPI000B1881F2|nr:dihydropteroate synthase [Synergistaceae bacterium DZ-S4]HAH68706.1 dihydropteroate synthase [Synergistaceae bacterium]HQA55232.1 dihydropteroate synthase [Synergistaceae bacterium]